MSMTAQAMMANTNANPIRPQGAAQGAHLSSAPRAHARRRQEGRARSLAYPTATRRSLSWTSPSTGWFVSSDLHSVKKAAEQDAFAKLLERLLEQPARAGFAAPGTLDVAPVQVRAIEGDAVLKLILIRHFREQNPGISPDLLTISASGT